MAKEILEINMKEISYSDPLRSSLISIIGILEAFLSKVSTRHHLRSVNSQVIDDLTVEELGNIYRQYFQNDNGKHGICWEYVIFNAIKYNNDFVIELLNNGINIIAGLNGFDELEVILWGGEKDIEIISEAKKLIKEDDLIWTPYGTYKLRDYIEIIYNSFSKKDIRETLPQNIQNIWKTDLFIKKKKSNHWFAVTVKWNKNELKKHNGLSIGIFYVDEHLLKNNFSPYIDYENDTTNTFIDFVKCAIPFQFNLGAYFIQNFNLVINLFENIHKRNDTINPFVFDTELKRNIFYWFHNHRGEKCKELISYLKYEFDIYITNNYEVESLAETSRDIVTRSNNHIFGINSFEEWSSDKSNKGILIKPN